ncbi:transcription-repair coupling factor [Ligilactobacillus hayakitensis DSM 18933 = JCM 14209]|uniref:Transcription-repair-coupling factor n=1 Tax=Ligilactobacillus hayakitensis DSM 18933 = JCM 14209 TaxID=1423755 RepID=A0A0R1WQ37_9LACO|nr:transcription-repair coupling factor [Ligilactobacillus hayakitensis]KRM19870.1 transcription-repair coupling factor [Ligilactobacillus hayakitensis DSM 18933 = JCM 14209]
MELQKIFLEVPEIKDWIGNLNENGRHLVSGLMGSAKTMLLASIFKEKQATMVLIEDDLYKAQALVSDLSNLLDENQVYLFPVEDMLLAQMATSSPENRSLRIQAMTALKEEKPVIIVTTVAAIQRPLPQVEFWQKHVLEFVLGDEFELSDLEKRLTEMGYERHNLVDAPGDFAIRGSIVDIYPLDQENPVRIDFFDVEVDSMRTFDLANQRSIENIEHLRLTPATDFIASKEQLQVAKANLQKRYQQQIKKLSAEQQKNLENHVQPMLADLEAGFIKLDYLPYATEILEKPATILDYVPESALIMFDDYPNLLEKQRELTAAKEQWFEEKISNNSLLNDVEFLPEIKDVEKKIKQSRVFLTLLQKGMGRLKFTSLIDVKTRSVQKFFGQMPLLKTEMSRFEKQGQTVVILVGDKERINKIEQTLLDFDMNVILTTQKDIKPKVAQLVEGYLNEGFEFPLGNLIFLTENELFAHAKRKQPKRMTMSNTERLKSYTDLKEGDYVVHENHGIGRYMGLQTLEVSGKHRDYLTLMYQNDAKVFIPVDQLDKVQKYVASESKTPRINKLGGTEWKKTKSRVASKIEDIADELVELYAKREAEKGFAFSKDDAYQREFEDAFPYTETDDQLRSTAEIKKDMEKPKPMDRLLIGDVGFGKTEVALRAAFKAVQDGKQVAFLAPTTVLAQQHYDTMARRFEDFPVEIGILSRFNSAKEVKQTLELLKDGKLDIIVGTHRLLSKDVKFNNIGLLIIDEEQRFGVKHKERLKELKSSVDVLTLTATPIPRTLNMSMLGVRDLSVIETAPQNRYPIQTFVIEKNYAVIADAIRREMKRDGQVFYLHNRVDDIESVAAELNDMVPEARIGYIHGRMTELQLERILMEFIEGQYDVLVTTTIIETGVDIPNVNTLFVDNADRMGLSQLYQLRGRVGRSNRIAYAYFMYQPNKVLTEVAEKRLEAIKDFTELGSGFKIAMRDLAIRGAGNLLGKQQHGFIDSVGYDMYTQMLNDAVAKKRGKKVRKKSNAEIILDIEAYLPTSYIEDPKQKIEIYKRLRQLENKEQYIEIQEDLIDRFGDYPDEVANLLEVSVVKMQADLALVDKIKQTKDQILVTLSKVASQKLSAKQLLKATAASQYNATVGEENGSFKLKLVIQPKMGDSEILIELQKLLAVLAEEMDENNEK